MIEVYEFLKLRSCASYGGMDINRIDLLYQRKCKQNRNENRIFNSKGNKKVDNHSCMVLKQCMVTSLNLLGHNMAGCNKVHKFALDTMVFSRLKWII